MSVPIADANRRNQNEIPNHVEIHPKRKWLEKSIIDVLDEPSPDYRYRENMWGPDFRSFIPSPIANPSYSNVQIMQSIGVNNIEAPAPQRSSFSCTFWIVVLVASVALIATSIIVPIVVLNNARVPTQAKPVPKLPIEPPLFLYTNEKSDSGLRKYLPITKSHATNHQESKTQTQDDKRHKESDTQATQENGESNVEAAFSSKNSKDRKDNLKLTNKNPIHKPPNSKNLISTGLGKGLAVGLGMGLGVGFRMMADKIFKTKEEALELKKKLKEQETQRDRLVKESEHAALKHRMQLKEIKQTEEESKKRQEEILEKIEKEKECKICRDNSWDHVLGCGHVCCGSCAKRVEHCPMCRKKVTSVIKIYN